MSVSILFSFIGGFVGFKKRGLYKEELEYTVIQCLQCKCKSACLCSLQGIDA